MADNVSAEPPPLRVLILAPALSGSDVGEVYSAFQWVEALSQCCTLTVLATSRGGPSLAEQLPEAEVITWPEPKILYQRFERFNAMAKPWLWRFSQQAQRWIREALAAGRHFDIAHQILPQALRHPCALRHFDIPYVIGPLGGGLPTPPGFASEVGGGGIGRLRALDKARLRVDPALRASYKRAAHLIGVAPYIGARLEKAGLKDTPFTAMLERGHGPLPALPKRSAAPGALQLLHVGRVIRTKALRDTVRAMGYLRDLPEVKLISVGDGPDLAACRSEAADLGLAATISFMGRIPREQVDAQYAAADVFCFPSFREPMGGVLFEAMEYGLPVIAADYGGPGFIIDQSSGIRLPVHSPDQLARAIAEAVRILALDPKRRAALGAGARARISAFGTWHDKAVETLNLYRTILADRTAAPKSAQKTRAAS